MGSAQLAAGDAELASSRAAVGSPDEASANASARHAAKRLMVLPFRPPFGNTRILRVKHEL